MDGKVETSNQRNHWDKTYQSTSDFFGHEPSEFGMGAMRTFVANGAKKILELGCGQGRDAIHFLKHGMEVAAFDYSETCVNQLMERAKKMGLDKGLTASVSDLRKGIPLPDESVDACFSHMFFTMHLSEKELAFIFNECHRVLKHGGINIYSVRNVNDPHYRKGKHHGEDMWENPMGFVVHFFSLEKVQRLAVGYDLLYTKEFDDPSPPFTKKLYEVVLLKP
ncbi:MAG: class I SAM-dependent methyltransferase [Methanomassiliicoccales archaeon]|nr:class I SAM-dependent methyltransferase [Methanomassiliicoccales archaeon]